MLNIRNNHFRSSYLLEYGFVTRESEFEFCLFGFISAMSALRAGSKKLNSKAPCNCQTFDALTKVTMSNAWRPPARHLVLRQIFASKDSHRRNWRISSRETDVRTADLSWR